ncbi:hypothetical protein FEK35_20710 [Nocardia cyriacigeorgica]|uniref:Uncharacterized protein n=1 Tax=Nocardia cyriacigeorgica TaxID=135487 RepID=A0A5R8P9Z5_9NOCA|nr:hypothetical protein [Nocardia cyriacigeorgica]TLG04253.1 hypothetical protein FEK35_20710 [Nocardia cyriacigeorgica]
MPSTTDSAIPRTAHAIYPTTDPDVSWRFALFDYRATWQIDITATDPLHAARTALAIQRDPDSTATVFDVVDEYGTTFRIDLAEESPTLDAQPVLAMPPVPRWIRRLLPRRSRRKSSRQP